MHINVVALETDLKSVVSPCHKLCSKTQTFLSLQWLKIFFPHITQDHYIISLDKYVVTFLLQDKIEMSVWSYKAAIHFKWLCVKILHPLMLKRTQHKHLYFSKVFGLRTLQEAKKKNSSFLCVLFIFCVLNLKELCFELEIFQMCCMASCCISWKKKCIFL